MRLRQAINEKLHMNDRLLALVRKTGYLQLPDEQVELIDHLESEKARLRLEMEEFCPGPRFSASDRAKGPDGVI